MLIRKPNFATLAIALSAVAVPIWACDGSGAAQVASTAPGETSPNDAAGSSPTFVSQSSSAHGLPATTAISEPDTGDSPDVFTVDASVADPLAEAGSVPNLAPQCVWVGYGIGAPPNKENDAMHLLSHSVGATSKASLELAFFFVS